jgi:anti-sigma regulatory factor (Ser/Thr protein kinase)
MPKLELEIGAHPFHVRTARLVAASLGRRVGLDGVVLDEIKLAVGEACARAVGVHRTAAVAEPILIRFCDDDDILQITVCDRGYARSGSSPHGDELSLRSLEAEAEAADLLAAATASLSEPGVPEHLLDVATLAPRLGLAVIAGLVDDMSVDDSSDPAGTAVTMRWPIVTSDGWHRA